LHLDHNPTRLHYVVLSDLKHYTNYQVVESRAFEETRKIVSYCW
jgi:hypothetical protein